MSTLASLDIEWAFKNVWTSSGGPDVKGFTFKKLSLEGTEYFRNRWSQVSYVSYPGIRRLLWCI